MVLKVNRLPAGAASYVKSHDSGSVKGELSVLIITLLWFMLFVPHNMSKAESW